MLQTAGALGVLLAKQLQRRLPGTPVGIIQVWCREITYYS